VSIGVCFGAPNQRCAVEMATPMNIVIAISRIAEKQESSASACAK
jgi:hypothetical protein